MTDTNHIIEALNKAGLDPFTLGQLRPSRMHVNKVFKTNFAKSRIMGKTWVLETLKGFQCLEVKFSDVQGCGFDSMQAFSLAFEKEQSNKK